MAVSMEAYSPLGYLLLKPKDSSFKSDFSLLDKRVSIKYTIFQERTTQNA